MRTLIIPLFFIATAASAQDPRAGQTKQVTKAPAPATPATKQDTKAAAPQTKTDTKAAAPGATKQDTKAGAPGTARPGITVAPPTPPKPVEILREAFDYNAAGRRDPFNSLMGSSELRPILSDLRLAGVLYHPTRPIATMQDLSTQTTYRVTLGSTLGRMRVVLIKPRVVIFSIEEFGLNRQDSLVLGDSTRARAR